jgi:hypothetical protein
MKASDKPVISKKWWTKEKPAEIKGADLEKALGVCEKALDEAKKKKDSESIDAALAALDDLDEAVETTVKECEKKKLKDVVTVLEKFEKLSDGERADLEKLKGALDQSDGEEESDDDAKGCLKEEYRARMIKMLRAGEQLQFCLGLNKQTPADSFLLLCNKRKPERLQKILKQTGDFSTRLLTFGTARADGKILDLNLADNSKEPAQIAKTSKEYFKSHRDLKFRKVRVHSAGETFEEGDPDDQEAPGVAGGAGAGDLQARIQKAQLADAAWQKVRNSISDQIAQVQRELNSFEDPDASTVHDGLSSLVDKLPDPGFNSLAKSGTADIFAINLEKTRQRMGELQRLIANGGALQAIDDNPFGVSTNVVDTVSKAMAEFNADLSLA